MLAFITACNEPEETTNTNKTVVSTDTIKTASNAIVSKNIRSIMQDNAGNIWFGSQGNQTLRYDGKTLTAFTMTGGLNSNYIYTIYQDEKGSMWFGTRDGIYHYDGVSFTNVIAAGSHTNIDTVKTWHKEAGDLWFWSNDGIYRYPHSSLFKGQISFEFLRLPEVNGHPRKLTSSSMSDYGIYTMYEDRGGKLWFGTQTRGVCCYDGTSFTWFSGLGLDKAAVRAICQDKAGNMWFGNNGAGVFRWDGKTLSNLTDEKGLANRDFLNGKAIGTGDKPGTLARLFSMAEDKDGNMWFGTIDAGVWKHDGTTITNFTTKDGLTSNAVNTIYKDRNGTLWFGTNDGVCTYDGTKFSAFAKMDLFNK